MLLRKVSSVMEVDKATIVRLIECGDIIVRVLEEACDRQDVDLTELELEALKILPSLLDVCQRAVDDWPPWKR